MLLYIGCVVGISTGAVVAGARGLDRATVALGLLTAVATCAVALAVADAVGLTGAVGLGMMVGGAAGNVYDRLARGGVVDFVAVGSYPRFNVADAALVAGALLLALERVL